MSLDVSLLSAFLGGLLTFLAPCTLPLIPAFLAFIGGASPGVNNLEKRKAVLFAALSFVSGFTVIFMLLGMASGTLGALFTLNKKLIAQVGGVLIIVLGFGMMGVIPLPSLGRITGKIPSSVVPGTRTGGFLLGLLFGLGWSPCLGPILGTILVLAATSNTALTGATLLFAYALGLGLPFLLLSYWYASSLLVVERIAPHTKTISTIGGALVVGLGLLMLIGQFGALTALGFDLYRIPLFSTLMDYM
jgi:cytochrome c-type biogenesis protein